jgi:hypothetical protein
VAAARRNGRDIKSRIESALNASKLHLKRTGRCFYLTEAIIQGETGFEDLDEPEHFLDPGLLLPAGCTREELWARRCKSLGIPFYQLDFPPLMGEHNKVVPAATSPTVPVVQASLQVPSFQGASLQTPGLQMPVLQRPYLPPPFLQAPTFSHQGSPNVAASQATVSSNGLINTSIDPMQDINTLNNEDFGAYIRRFQTEHMGDSSAFSLAFPTLRSSSSDPDENDPELDLWSK